MQKKIIQSQIKNDNATAVTDFALTHTAEI